MTALAFILLAGSTGADSFVNFESAHVRPLALSPGGELLLAVNTPDNRLEVFRPEGGSLSRVGEVVVGLEPVAVAAREGEVWVTNHLSDSVAVVDVSSPERPRVKKIIPIGDEPQDVVIGGPRRDRVFVATAHRGQNRPGDPQLTTPGVGRADIWILDANDLEAEPRILTLFCDAPRGLAVTPDGRRVYAAAFHSGNRTTAINELAVEPFWFFLMGDGFFPPGQPPPLENGDGIPAPLTGLILRYDGSRWVDALGRDWSPRVRFDLPDHDVFAIDAAGNPPAIIGRASGVGTILFNLAVHPTDGKVFVSNLESRNHVRFEPALRGHPVENRVTIMDGFDGGAPRAVHLNPHIDYSRTSGTPEEIEASLALPLGMEFSAGGERLYLAAFGSGRVAVLDGEGEVLERIDVGGGPSGLALHEAAGRLYVMNRFDHTISIVDLESLEEVEVVPLGYNPEPPAVRRGRPLLYDARRASGHGDAACGSCHIFADCDGLAWDLGNPEGSLQENPIVRVPVLGNEPLRPFHPMMGPMTTKSLRGLAGAGALHWRGDLNGGGEDPFDTGKAFLNARSGFHGILGKEGEIPLEQMERLRDFVLDIRYPPNPVASLDGSLTPEQAAGKEIFESDGDRHGLGGSGTSCASCHVPPLGTDGHGVTGRDQDIKVAQLRGLYQKVGMFGYASPGIVSYSPVTLEPVPTPHLGEQVRGFGFRHDGTMPLISDHLREPLEAFIFPDEPGRSGLEKVRQIESFLLAFPTGLAPVVGQQVTVDRGAAERPAGLERLQLLADRAGAGDGDLVCHGILRGEARGFLGLEKGGPVREFQSDRRVEIVSWDDLMGAVRAGVAVLTFTVAPPGSGRRIAIDRDGDGALDRDESDQGFDPADPASHPMSFILRGDCNGDLEVSLSDVISGLEVLFRGGGPPPCPFACDSSGDGSLDISDSIYTLFFLFQGGPPPGAYPACEDGPPACADLCPR